MILNSDDDDNNTIISIEHYVFMLNRLGICCRCWVRTKRCIGWPKQTTCVGTDM